MDVCARLDCPRDLAAALCASRALRQLHRASPYPAAAWVWRRLQDERGAAATASATTITLRAVRALLERSPQPGALVAALASLCGQEGARSLWEAHDALAAAQGPAAARGGPALRWTSALATLHFIATHAAKAGALATLRWLLPEGCLQGHGVRLGGGGGAREEAAAGPDAARQHVMTAALLTATAHGRLDAMEWLLRSGADVHAEHERALRW